MSASRTDNAIRNVKTALIGQGLNIVLNFVCRTIFIYTLGKTYLGVSGLFSNILSIMSLAELGIGDAIVYKMYKPVAEKDYEQIKSYMQFYKKAYWIIGSFIFCVGLLLTPFLEYLINGTTQIENLQMIYVLYLVNTSATYFFAYKRLIINTDQKGYIDTINRYVFLTIQNVLQIIALLLFKNYILYLLIQILLNLLANISIAHKVNKMYPYLRGEAKPLEKKNLQEIFKQTVALVIHKVGGVCVSGTDNLLLSAFVGINWVGIYSNYVTILSIPQTLLAYIFSPMTASVGNLVATSDKNHSYKTFKKMFFINFWLYGFCAICLYVLFNSFIAEVWLDESFALSKAIVFFIVLNFYLNGMRQVVAAFKSTSGLFWNDRFRPLAEAIVNLVASVVLLKIWGFIGVLIGTTISYVCTTVWVEALIVYKHVFNKHVINFFITYAKYFLSVCLIGTITNYICSRIVVSGIGSFIIQAIVCVLLSNLGFLLLYFNTNEFKQLWKQMVDRLVKRRL